MVVLVYEYVRPPHRSPLSRFSMQPLFRLDVLKIHMLKSQPSVPQKVNILGDRVLKVLIKIK